MITDEHDRHLCGAASFVYRLFPGFTACEGMRHDQAEPMTWADFDLKHGIVRLDENKTDEPR